MIHFEQVSKIFQGKPAVDDLTLHIAEGEFTVLIGTSGSGKSTTLKMINRLIEHDRGKILFAGEEIQSFKPQDLRRRMGYAIQSIGLFPHWTVEENIATVPQLLKWPRARIRDRVTELLELLHLEPELFRRRYPHQLSGGQQQRVAIGRALVYNPPVILLDEPLSNLDAKLREEARVFLRELIIKLGLSALMVTHDQNEAMAISDRILLLNNGKIEQQGTPQEMYGSPTTLFTAEFMGSNNRLPGKIVALEGDRARIEGKDWALWGKAGEGVQVGQEGSAVIRVERVRLGEDPQGNQLELP
ncbi:ABC transporter ATP-binding protein, partial [Staphylococcus aureus]|nr:ABC transporter ATP-binding protein [Staphylococcus aureus]